MELSLGSCVENGIEPNYYYFFLNPYKVELSDFANAYNCFFFQAEQISCVQL